MTIAVVTISTVEVGVGDHLAYSTSGHGHSGGGGHVNPNQEIANGLVHG